MFQKIDGCSYADVNDIDSRLKADNDGGYGTVTNEEIVASCSTGDTEETEVDNMNSQQLCVTKKQCPR